MHYVSKCVCVCVLCASNFQVFVVLVKLVQIRASTRINAAIRISHSFHAPRFSEPTLAIVCVQRKQDVVGVAKQVFVLVVRVYRQAYYVRIKVQIVHDLIG